jgi:acyl-CoA reductase-like NAD-dependent aldehyde dehydrogenase
MAIQRFETEEQAIKLANETSYGLAGAVFSSQSSTHKLFGSSQVFTDTCVLIRAADVNQCMRVSSALEVGTCCE